jgi:hypothetical protein
MSPVRLEHEFSLLPLVRISTPEYNSPPRVARLDEGATLSDMRAHSACRIRPLAG